MNFALWPRKNRATPKAGPPHGTVPGQRADSATQRRRFVREMVRVPVTLLDGNDLTLATGATIEVSEGGIRAHLNGAVLLEGTRVRTRLDLPGSASVTIDGLIRRSPGLRRPTAIQFSDGHPHQDALRQLVFAAQRAKREARG